MSAPALASVGAFVTILGLACAPLAAQATVGRTDGEASVSTTGASQYSIPLRLPQGRSSELTPSLALHYRSSIGNGVVGMGIAVSGLSAITRCVKTIAQDGTSSSIKKMQSDAYCLDGRRLRLVSGDYGAAGSEYRTEIDSIAKIVAQGPGDGGGPASFIVRHKSGLDYEYGTTASSSITFANSSIVREWALAQVRDRAGNTIDFSYAGGPGSGSYRPDEIRYTGGPFVAPYTVKFDYQDGRPDTIFRYIAGDLVGESMLLTRVRILHGGNPVRQYLLDYLPPGTSRRARLESITECGPSASNCFAPTVFEWTDSAASLSAEQSVGQTIPNTGSTWHLIDMDGDGRDDLVYVSSTAPGGTWRVRKAQVGGGFGTEINTGLANTNYAQAMSLEWDGDGSMDLLVPYSGGRWHVLRSTGNGFAPPFDTGITAVSSDYVRPFDINGDGRDDLARISSSGTATVWVRYREANNFSATELVLWSSTSSSVQFQAGFGPYQNKYRSRIRRADFDGDGREDFIAALGQYDPESSQTVWDYHVFFAGAPGSPIDPQSPDKGGNHLFADLNGDGLTDLVWVQVGNYFRYAYASGGELQLPQNGPGTTGYNPLASIATDYDGDGRDDILIPRVSPATLHFVRSTGDSLASPFDTGVTGVSNVGVVLFTGDLDGNGYADLAIEKPGGALAYRLQSTTPRDLLESVTDGFGVATSFTYAPISDPAVHARLTGAQYPVREYQFGSQIVKQLSASDGVAGTYAVTYQYKGARRHVAGRGYLGFAERTLVDSRTGLRTVESYRQDFPYVGALASRTTYQSAASSTKVAQLSNTWQKQTLAPLYQERHLPFVSVAEFERYEVGGPQDGDLITTTTTTSIRDEWGSVIDQQVAVTAANESSSFVTRSFVPDPATNMLNDQSNWCLGRPRRTHITSTLPNGVFATRRASADYDAALCRVTEEIIEPDQTDPKLRLTKAFGYDGCGNRNGIALSGDDGFGAATSRVTSTGFDSACRFPTSMANAEGHIQQMTWDAALGAMTSHRDGNNQLTTWQHDDFGRLEVESRPDGSSATWTYSWCTNGCGLSHATGVYGITVTESTGAQSTVIYDAFGREVRQTRLILGGAASHVDTIYDARGHVVQRSAPYLSGAPVLWNAFGYDALARPTSRQAAGFNASSIAYEGFTTRAIDPEGRLTTRTSNAIGEVVQVQDALNAVTTYEYAPFGNLVRTTDPASHNMQFSYDIRGRKIESIDPDMGQWTYVHSSFDELVSSRHGSDQPTQMHYDRLGRLTQRNEPEGSTDFIWDTAAYGVGRLNLVTAPHDSYAEIYVYDQLGRQQEVTTTIGAEMFPITTTYDAHGRLATIEYPESNELLSAPNVPSSITVPASSTNGNYVINWGVAGGTVAAYELYEATNSSFSGAVQAYSGTSTSFAVSGKGNGTFYYRVRACNGVGCGGYRTGSNPASVTLPPAVPSSITVPASSTTGNYTVSWGTASGNVTAYQLYEATNSSFSGAVQAYSGTSTSFAVSGKGNGTFYYRVRACNGAACSGYRTGANPTSVTLPPGTPSSITVPANSTTGSFTVSWGTASGNVTAYQLYEATNSSFSGAVQVYSGTSTSFAVSGKGNGTFYYRVRACNGTACSGYRNGANPTSVTLPPGTPSISAPANSTSGSYTVSWSVPSGNVTAYELYEAPYSTFAGEVLVYSGSGTSTGISGKNDGTYYYRVRACNGATCGNFSAGTAVSVTWPPSIPPSISMTNPINGTFAVIWGASSGSVTAYQVYEATNPNFDWEWMVYSGTSTSTVIVERPPGGYWYRVRACNGAACSGFRSGGPVNVLPGGPGDPPLRAPETDATATNTTEAPEDASMNTRVTAEEPPDSVPQPAWTRSDAEKFADAVRAVRAHANRRAQAHRGDTQPGPELGPALLQWSADARAGEGLHNTLDELRRVQSEPEPYRFRVRYEYDAYGHLQRVVNDDNPQEQLWQATAMNAAGQVTAVTYGNALSSSRTYDAVSGAIKQISTGSGGSIQSLSYEWNDAGYLERRQDLGRGLLEQYQYDALYRLEGVSGPSAMSVSYSAIGNIATKSGVGTYEYDPSKPHQVTQVTGGSGGPVLQSFAYDTRGNMTSRNGSSITWTSYDLPSQINEGADSSQFSYGAYRNRFRQIAVQGGQSSTTIYVGGGLYERITQGTLTTHRHYVVGGDGVFAVHERNSELAGQTRYLHSDHLGSVDAISDAQGALLARLSFDAFGRRRGSLWTGALSGSEWEAIGQATRRGYTLHEHLDNLELVHMNGRVYDPTLGRFLSADPFVLEPFNAQSLNRYSYVLNSPLSYTDPSGYQQFRTLDEFGTPGGTGATHNGHAIDLGAWLWVTGSIGGDIFASDLDYPQPAAWALTRSPSETPPDPQTIDVGSTNSTVSGNPFTGFAEPGSFSANAGYEFATDPDISDRTKWTVAGTGMAVMTLGTALNMVPLAAGPLALLMDVQALGDGMPVGRFGPMRPGPLPAKVAETFRSSSYTGTTLTEATTFYRAYGGTAGPTSIYWTRTPPSGPLQAMIDSALLPQWGNTALNVSRIRVPAGATIYEGAAAAQGGLVGGGSQVVIPNVNPAWLLQ